MAAAATRAAARMGLSRCAAAGAAGCALVLASGAGLCCNMVLGPWLRRGWLFLSEWEWHLLCWLLL
jgi:hypothetical protein